MDEPRTDIPAENVVTTEMRMPQVGDPVFFDRGDAMYGAVILAISSDESKRKEGVPAVSLAFVHKDRRNMLGGSDWRLAFDRVQDVPFLGPAHEPMAAPFYVGAYGNLCIVPNVQEPEPFEEQPSGALPSAADLDATAAEQKAAEDTAGTPVNSPPQGTEQITDIVRYDCAKCHMAMYLAQADDGHIFLYCPSCGHSADKDSVIPYRGEGGNA